jgi:hypothetical protein
MLPNGSIVYTSPSRHRRSTKSKFVRFPFSHFPSAWRRFRHSINPLLKVALSTPFVTNCMVTLCQGSLISQLGMLPTSVQDSSSP